MAYAFNSLSPLLQTSSASSQSGGVGSQSGGASAPQATAPATKPETTPVSKFEDPNDILSSNVNNNSDQSAVNTAVSGKATQTFNSNTADLQSQENAYTAAQSANAPTFNMTQSQVNSDVKGGGNQLSSLLSAPQYQAQAFNYNTQNQQAQPQALQDYSGQLANTMTAGRPGSFYTQGDAALDAGIYKASGQQSIANQGIQAQQAAFNAQLAGDQANLQNQATTAGQAQQAAAQSQARGDINNYLGLLKQQDQADLAQQIQGSDYQAEQNALNQAQSLGSTATQQQIDQIAFNNGQYVNPQASANYVSNANLGQENTIQSLLGQAPISSAGTVSQYINTAAQNQALQSLINSNIAPPPGPAGPPSPVAGPLSSLLTNSPALLAKYQQDLANAGYTPPAQVTTVSPTGIISNGYGGVTPGQTAINGNNNLSGLLR